MKADCYLLFNGNCRDAMTFYSETLGAQLHMSGYGDMPGAEKYAGSTLVMHACMTKDALMIMASDCPPEQPVVEGNNFSVSIGCDTPEAVDALFPKLSEGGTVLQAPHDAFWGSRFAMLKDKFGIGWMLVGPCATAPTA